MAGEENKPEKWIELLLILSRGAYQLAVESVDDRETVESYGVLGECKIIKDKRGFHRNENYQGDVANLLFRPYLEEDKIQYWVEAPEQFFADLGQIRYFKHLLSLGLDKNEIVKTYQNFAFFPFMQQGLIDIQNTEGVGGAEPWQEWWGEALKFDRIDELHRESDRFELFYGIGERIVEKNNNRYSVELSAENTAALGMVAFSDFVDYQLTNHRILASLERKALSPASIVQDAVWLYFRMHEEDQLPLPLEQAQMKPNPTSTV